MKEVIRTVYYCDHCSRRYFQKAAGERHERGCVRNPDRSCGWCYDLYDPLIWRWEKKKKPSLRWLISVLKRRHHRPLEFADIDWLEEKLSGCPACMLAVFLQGGFDWRERDHETLFDYEAQVHKFRDKEFQRMERYLGWTPPPRPSRAP